MENHRVLQFIEHLKAASDQNKDTLIAAGECMLLRMIVTETIVYSPSPKLILFVDAVRARGPQKGLYGAKITGGGSGGTVAVFGDKEALAREIPAITRDYQRLTGLEADISRALRRARSSLLFSVYIRPNGMDAIYMKIRKAVVR